MQTIRGFSTPIPRDCRDGISVLFSSETAFTERSTARRDILQFDEVPSIFTQSRFMSFYANSLGTWEFHVAGFSGEFGLS